MRADQGTLAVMNPSSPQPGSEAVALHRYALLTKLQDLLHQRLPLPPALETVAAAPSTGPDGLEFNVAKRTLEDWWYAYKKGGFAALHPKSRCDRGQPRSLTEIQQRFVLDQVRAHLALPIKVLYRHWKQSDPSLPGLSSIYRWLERHDLHHKARRYQMRQSISGPTKAFELPVVNDLWMVDFSPGPFLTIPGRVKAVPIHLCAIIDDHSRLITAALYHPRADTQSFHFTLKDALRRRGLPRAIYTDQGGPFTNDHTRLVCAKLGLRLLHARPYHSWSKGKIERFFRTCQEDFEATLRLPDRLVHSFDELNARLADWLQCVYHARVHSGTDQAPAERFQRSSHLIRSLDPHLDLDRLFHSELQRLARQWGASDVPFNQSASAEWLDTPEILHARRQLEITAALKSTLLVSGPNGVGKSALAGRWLRSMDPRLYAAVSLIQATLSGSSLLATLVAKLGKAPSFRREGNLQRLDTALAELEHRTLVVVLDEAQNFSHAALEETRLLLGLNLPEQPAFALVLLGDDYLLGTLQLRNHRAPFSRLAGHLGLALWTQAQSIEFLEGGLRAVGLTPGHLEPAAGELLSSAAAGLPRSLALLARAAWIAAASAGVNRLTPSHVQSALDQVPCVPGLQRPMSIASAGADPAS